MPEYGFLVPAIGKSERVFADKIETVENCWAENEHQVNSRHIINVRFQPQGAESDRFLLD